MKHTVTGLFFVLCVLCVAKQSECYRILGIIPVPSYSHQTPYRRLWLELHERGHEIVLVTSHPMQGINSPNFTQIDVSEGIGVLRKVNFVQERLNGKTWCNFAEKDLLELCDRFARTVFEFPQMKKLYAPDSNERFDVFLTEFLYTPSLYAFAHRFNVPMIALSSLGMFTLNEHVLGGLVLPSHEYTWEMEANTGPNLWFTKRLWNFVAMWRHLYLLHRDIFPAQQKLAESYLGPLPPMSDLMRNVSAFFLDQPDVLTAARPKLANVITFTSTHIEENPDPLPKDLQEFLDGADTGFIYFSLGSNARSADLSMELLRMFCDVFAKLPYRVVWKFETDLVEKPSNVYTGKWFSQQAILAHPKIKLFITQGGLQSIEEAIHFGVPVIVIPVLGDQDYQAARVNALGIGTRLELRTITKDEIENAVQELITNTQYKERMIRIQNLTRDTPYDLVKNLAWWTEYVVRSDGAPHLRSSLAMQPWYQYCDMDIVVFLTSITCLIIPCALNLISKLIVHSYKIWQLSAYQKRKVC
ncbi:Ecdysteroid UDP-glucosyltransferase [Eufriesea mexicana]|uniref:UDP-glucuronosyltransferase n=1 Tax=Eufriesea mexicana TaxID=516756 RepID=A0A310SMZ2_9HYME|nr:PREDICTED: UDP-glucuronosyltransferase 2B15-like [Eufriesea mexicana]OAD62502.1 Ecdysteroid UDP-glucosyltransferase [Eufriesea mexicana]